MVVTVWTTVTVTTVGTLVTVLIVVDAVLVVKTLVIWKTAVVTNTPVTEDCGGWITGVGVLIAGVEATEIRSVLARTLKAIVGNDEPDKAGGEAVDVAIDATAEALDVAIDATAEALDAAADATAEALDAAADATAEALDAAVDTAEALEAATALDTASGAGCPPLGGSTYGLVTVTPGILGL